MNFKKHKCQIQKELCDKFLDDAEFDEPTPKHRKHFITMLNIISDFVDDIIIEYCPWCGDKL